MKMDDKFVLDRYNFELQRKEQLNGSLTFPVALLTAIGSALAAMIRSFTFQEPAVTSLFWFVVAVAVICITICTVLLFRTYHNQTFVYMPLLGFLEEWAEENAAWLTYVEANGGNPGEEETFAQNLRRRIIEAADANTSTNDQRSAWMHSARLWLIGAFVATAIAGMPYAFDQVRAQYVEQLNKTAGTGQTTSPPPATPRRVPGQ